MPWAPPLPRTINTDSDDIFRILLFLLLSLEFEPCDPHIKLNKIYDDRNQRLEKSHQVTVLNTIKSYVCVFGYAHTHTHTSMEHEALWKVFFAFLFLFIYFGFKHFCHSQQDTHINRQKIKVDGQWNCRTFYLLNFFLLFLFVLVSCYVFRFFSFLLFGIYSRSRNEMAKSKCWTCKARE